METIRVARQYCELIHRCGREKILPNLVGFYLYTGVYNPGQHSIYILHGKHSGNAQRITQMLRFVIDNIRKENNRRFAIYRVCPDGPDKLETCDHRQVSAADYQVETFDPRG